MTVAEVAARVQTVPSDSGHAPRGVARFGCSVPLTAVEQPGGTLALRAHDIPCRALEDPGTVAAFALWIGPGM